MPLSFSPKSPLSLLWNGESNGRRILRMQWFILCTYVPTATVVDEGVLQCPFNFDRTYWGMVQVQVTVSNERHQ